MKNGEGYRDPTAGAAVQNAFRSERQKSRKTWDKVAWMKRRGLKKCKSYKENGCKKRVDGKVETCPLAGDWRACNLLVAPPEEIMDAYDKMFPGKWL